MYFNPPIYFCLLLLYTTVSNVIIKSHSDLSFAKVPWVGRVAPLLFLPGSLCGPVERADLRWLLLWTWQMVLLSGCLLGGFPNVVGWIGWLPFIVVSG